MLRSTYKFDVSDKSISEGYEHLEVKFFKEGMWKLFTWSTMVAFVTMVTMFTLGVLLMGRSYTVGAGPPLVYVRLEFESG
jgi:hypothetical protein